MSDHKEIDQLLHDYKVDPSESQYVETQYEFLNDIQNGSYTSGMVTFDTMNLRDKYVVYKDSYLMMPISIVSGTAGKDLIDTSLVTVKRAVTDFIYGLTVTTGSGATIVSDQNIVTINHIRLLVESSFEQWQEEGASLFFSKDRVSPTPATAAHNSIVQPVASVTNNLGYAERVAWFKQACKYDATAKTISTVVVIPLKYIHDLFMQMDFPIINLRLQLSFFLNMYSNGSIVPALGGAVDSTDKPQPVATIGAAYIPGTNIQLNACRLYYKRVVFHPELNVKMSQRLAQGFVKMVDFRCADTYLPTANDTNKGANDAITKLVTSSSIHPLRVWLIAPKTGALSGSTIDSSGLMPLANYVGGFTNANCLVGNMRYYANDLISPADFYNILKEQFPEKQGLLNFSDFLSTYRLHCFDLTRLKDRVKNPNEAVSIQINASRSDSTSCDYYVIIERLQRVSFHMNSGESSVVVGLQQ